MRLFTKTILITVFILVAALFAFESASADSVFEKKYAAESAETNVLPKKEVILQKQDSATDTEESSGGSSVCLFWGLIGSCGFEAEASTETESGNISGMHSDQADVELTGDPNKRSILWGAVQWSRGTADATPEEDTEMNEN